MRDLTMHELDSQLAEQLPARELMTVMRPTYKPPAGNQWAAAGAQGGNGGDGGRGGFNPQIVVQPQIAVLGHNSASNTGGANGGSGGSGGNAGAFAGNFR